MAVPTVLCSSALYDARKTAPIFFETVWRSNNEMARTSAFSSRRGNAETGGGNKGLKLIDRRTGLAEST
jgi:hypothetical protein